MGVVPQEDNLDEEITVLDNLLIHARYHGMKPRIARPKAHRAARVHGARRRRRDHEIRELSGGMKRRLMIARGLLNSPEILILDEPTTGLDPQARHLVWERLRTLKRQGVTLLLTTHYMDEAAQLCDELVIMHEGTVLVEGAPRELVAAAHVARGRRGASSRRPSCTPTSMRSASVARSVEKLADRWLFYTDEGDAAAREGARAAAPARLSSWLRGSALEDVFLALTGRGLLD